MEAFHFRSEFGPEQIQRELEQLSLAIKGMEGRLEGLRQALGQRAVEERLVTPEQFSQLVEVRTKEWKDESVDEADKQEAEDIAAELDGLEEYQDWIEAGSELAAARRRRAELEKILEEAQRFQLAESVYGFFANGGAACYILRLDDSGDIKAQITGEAAKRTGLAGLETVPDVTMVAVPDLWTATTSAEAGAEVMGDVVAHCSKMRNRIAILEPPPGTEPGKLGEFLDQLASPDTDDAAFSALYYPWVKVPGVDGSPRTVPPCGHIAGVWARTDAERGVFKAPANQNLRGVQELPVLLTDDRQGTLNDRGVNCLRDFPGRGLLVWGARTRSSSRDWKYLNVRRLVCFLSDSIRQSSTWAVFEPNDDRLWATLRHSVTSFLTDQWRQGALLGRTPDEAFYVVCDRTNNTEATMDAGQVICDIGIAPVRPAEFVHFTITQIAGQPGQSN
ncbi:phage tail sheath C-terminal domain-containing protein [Streptomyces sp. NPDC054765]